jgi:hypothetical protein
MGIMPKTPLVVSVPRTTAFGSIETARTELAAGGGHFIGAIVYFPSTLVVEEGGLLSTALLLLSSR